MGKVEIDGFESSKDKADNGPIKLSDDQLGISGGNKLDDELNTWYGKLYLSTCREDVRKALKDNSFTDKLLAAKNSVEVKKVFDDRGVSVTQREVDICWKVAEKYR